MLLHIPQASVDAVNNNKPATKTGFRPCLSDNGPQIRSEILNPTNHKVRDIVTHPIGMFQFSEIIGMAGKYMSIESGGQADNIAR